MPCGSCVDKLALKLVLHHKIDLIRAYELAEKGVERVENRVPAEIKSGNPTDYTLPCTQGTCTGVDPTTTCTKIGLDCTVSSNCVGGSCKVTGSCGCPAPVAHSTLISNCTITCAPIGTCAKCLFLTCVPTCTRSTCTNGTCGYDCDEGYVWNPVTLACELPAAPPAKPLINMPLVNPILVNPPIVRAFK